MIKELKQTQAEIAEWLRRDAASEDGACPFTQDALGRWLDVVERACALVADLEQALKSVGREA